MMAEKLPEFSPDFASPSEWAAMYRAVGLQVVPARYPMRDRTDKRPMLAGWTEFQNALVADAVFSRWYGPAGEHRNVPNMGLISGAASGNIGVIDLDDHSKPEADHWWRGLLELNTYGIDLETWCQVTGGGGRQLFFRFPEGWHIPTNRTPIGVDIRGQGGFAMLPPSVHMSGKEYAWFDGMSPWETQVLDAPQWLMDAIDDLVLQYGGDKSFTERPERTASPVTDFDVFGARVDGREDAMTRAVWGAVVGMHRATAGVVTEDIAQEHFEQAVAKWLRETKTRLKGVDNAEGLERECRGRAAFQAKWQRAMLKWDGKVAADAANPRLEPVPQAQPFQDARPEGVSATPFVWIDPRTIPPREWIYGHHYIRKFLSTTVAPGGVGKSSLTISESIAIATGLPLLGTAVDEQTNVWLWNGEDPLEELQRRIIATALHFNIDERQLAGRLFVDSGRHMPIVVAERTRDGVVINAPLVEQVIATIRDNNIGVMIIDPFISCHRVTENDNSEIERVAKTWAHIADITSCSIELVHHVRKTSGAEIQVEDGRGAVALLSAARAARALNRMTDDEAARAGVEARRHFRADDGKANLAPPATAATWFHLASFDLGNATRRRPSDHVGVVERWEWPDPSDGVTGTDVEIVRARVAQGNYRADWQAEDWVGKVIIDVLGLSNDPASISKARAVQAMWTKTGALREVEGKDEKRRLRKFVRVGNG